MLHQPQTPSPLLLMMVTYQESNGLAMHPEAPLHCTTNMRMMPKHWLYCVDSIDSESSDHNRWAPLFESGRLGGSAALVPKLGGLADAGTIGHEMLKKSASSSRQKHHDMAVGHGTLVDPGSGCQPPDWWGGWGTLRGPVEGIHFLPVRLLALSRHDMSCTLFPPMTCRSRRSCTVGSDAPHEQTHTREKLAATPHMLRPRCHLPLGSHTEGHVLSVRTFDRGSWEDFSGIRGSGARLSPPLLGSLVMITLHVLEPKYSMWKICSVQHQH